MRQARLTLLVAGCFLLLNTVAAQDKPATIKEIMEKLNKPGALHPTLAKELKVEAPAWDQVQQDAKKFAKIAADLGKNAPPKGSQTSWDKLTKDYADNAKALETAAEHKDLTAARAAQAKLGGMSCATCHKAHKK